MFGFIYRRVNWLYPTTQIIIFNIYWSPRQHKFNRHLQRFDILEIYWLKFINSKEFSSRIFVNFCLFVSVAWILRFPHCHLWRLNFQIPILTPQQNITITSITISTLLLWNFLTFTVILNDPPKRSQLRYFL